MYSTGLPPLVPRARAAVWVRARAAASFGAWPRHARHQAPDQRPTAFGSDAISVCFLLVSFRAAVPHLPRASASLSYYWRSSLARLLNAARVDGEQRLAAAVDSAVGKALVAAATVPSGGKRRNVQRVRASVL